MTPAFLATYPAMTQAAKFAPKKPVDHDMALIIVRRVAVEHGVCSSHIMGEFRDRPSLNARRAAMKVIRDSLNWSTTDIGKFFDRDHTTVLHALGMLARNKAKAAA